MFYGRQEELEQLEKLYLEKKSKLITIYGRRRTGKSYLVENFFKNKKHLRFEGLEREPTKIQIQNFLRDFAEQADQPLLADIKSTSWNLVFDQLTKYLKANKKLVLFFDEFQWMAVQKSSLVALIKKYWDQHWKNMNVMLILCGSISSYMVNKVIKSKALYGRISAELLIKEMPFYDTQLFLKNRSPFEVFQYQLLFGGIPKYWDELNSHQSFEQNTNRLFFQSQGYLFNDYEKIFYSQFKEPAKYEKIISVLKYSPLNLSEIADKIKTTSGGGLSFYLDNLEIAGFISSYTPFDKGANSKLKKYKITDDYLRFYFQYIEPNKQQILNQRRGHNFFSLHIKKSWQVWAGLAFENFCLKNAIYMADKMGFAQYVLRFGPYFQKGSKGFQIDLLYQRSDNVITLCEIKFSDRKITTKVIPEVQDKINKIKAPKKFTIEKALISIYGPDEALTESQYFDHALSLEELRKA